MYDRLDHDEIIKLLDNLIGATNPCGSEAEDKRRLKRLKVLIDVTNWCLLGIKQSAEYQHCMESSVREIGQTAITTLDEYRTWLNEVLENELGL